jgi:hypothetical protein
VRELEVAHDLTNKEVTGLADKLAKMEKENLQLKRNLDQSYTTNSTLQDKVRQLSEHLSNKEAEKQIADKVTTELLNRVAQMEN